MYVHVETRWQRHWKHIFIAFQGLACGLFILWAAFGAFGLAQDTTMYQGVFQREYYVASLAILAPILAAAIALQYGSLDRYTRYYLTAHTLAIKSPGKPPKFIRKADCTHYNASRQELILENGERQSIARADFLHRRRSGLEAHIFDMWWPGLNAQSVINEMFSTHPLHLRAFGSGMTVFFICQSITLFLIRHTAMGNTSLRIGNWILELDQIADLVLGLGLLGVLSATLAVSVNIPNKIRQYRFQYPVPRER